MLAFCLNFFRQVNTYKQCQEFLYNMILCQDNYLYYKWNENKNKSIAWKCNENATGYYPGKQPFATTRNNNGKVRFCGIFLFSYK